MDQSRVKTEDAVPILAAPTAYAPFLSGSVPTWA
jgi:hypothetical protein